jgi:hypothetical protein
MGKLSLGGVTAKSIKRRFFAKKQSDLSCICALAIFGSLVSLAPMSARAQGVPHEIAELKAQVAALQSQVHALETEFAAVQSIHSQVHALQTQLAAVESNHGAPARSFCYRGSQP